MELTACREKRRDMARGKRRHRATAPQPSPQSNHDAPGQVPGTRVATLSESHYSGPLPQASDLEAYNRIDPTFANRIVTMAESFAAHTQRLEAEAMRQERSDQRWARGVAAGVVLAVLATCIWALHLDKEEFATSLGSWTIVALASVFIAGKIPDWIKRKRP